MSATKSKPTHLNEKAYTQSSSMADNNETRRTAARPTITPPHRTNMEALFNNEAPALSPGPMTLVSSFFSDSDECKSFSQLLTGVMTSPTCGRSSGDAGIRHSNQPGLVVAPPPSTWPAFMVPQGLSSAALFDSNGMFSPGQGPFGMSRITHQQALAQITAQAVQAQSPVHIQGGFASSPSASPATSATWTQTFTTSTKKNHHALLTFPDSRVTVKESPEVSHLIQSSQSPTLTVDKPADDGYRWRKYGQKQVKGSEFPRSYYKCTHPNCPVTKKVERSLDGQVTEIIYKGQHNHQPPQGNKRVKDGGVLNGTSSNRGDRSSHVNFGSVGNMCGKDDESSQATAEHITGSSDSEEVGGGMVEKDEDERDPKRRIVDAGLSEPASLHRSVAEPRIIVQTTSEVDLLDDGYRWRKYGQKVVKGNPYPRSYYKCTTPGCNVRKHIERSPADPKAVITTYEGKHIHDVPAAKSSSHSIASSNASQFKSYNSSTQKHALSNQSYVQSNSQEVAHLRLKEEQIT